MAYSTSSPPYLVSQGIGNSRKRWRYDSADAATVVRVANYITNAYSLGIRQGDTVEVWDNDSSPPAVTFMTVVSCTKSGATETCDLSDGTAITATNSD